MNRILPLSELRRADIDGAGFAFGVFSGISHWLGIPVWTARVAGFLAAIGLSMCAGQFGLPVSIELSDFHMSFELAPAILAYIVAVMFMPEWEALPEDFEQRTGIKAEPALR